MAYRILSAAIVACLATAGASAQTTTATSETRCSRDAWTHVYHCRSEYDSPYSNTTTYCASGRGGASCDTETVRKPQPKVRLPDPPYVPPPQPTAERDPRYGVQVMRGMPER
jgi:hypothetical protein